MSMKFLLDNCKLFNHSNKQNYTIKTEPFIYNNHYVHHMLFYDSIPNSTKLKYVEYIETPFFQFTNITISNNSIHIDLKLHKTKHNHIIDYLNTINEKFKKFTRLYYPSLPNLHENHLFLTETNYGYNWRIKSFHFDMIELYNINGKLCSNKEYTYLISPLHEIRLIFKIIGIEYNIFVNSVRIIYNIRQFQYKHTISPNMITFASDTISNNEIINNTLTENSTNIAKSSITFFQHTIYGKYFRMLSMGIPQLAIEQKAKLDGLHSILEILTTYQGNDCIPQHLLQLNHSLINNDTSLGMNESNNNTNHSNSNNNNNIANVLSSIKLTKTSDLIAAQPKKSNQTTKSLHITLDDIMQRLKNLKKTNLNLRK